MSRYYFYVEALYDGVAPLRSPETRARPGAMFPNDEVNTIAIASDGSTYFGGRFTEMAVPTGGGVVLDAATGKLVSSFVVEGQVSAVVPDGQDGWYIGGNFKYVNGVPRLNRAHILADDNVDPSFYFPVGPESYAPVSALLLDGDRLFVGGAFTTVAGQDRPYLAGINLATHGVDARRPAPDSNVNALLARISAVCHIAAMRFMWLVLEATTATKVHRFFPVSM